MLKPFSYLIIFFSAFVAVAQPAKEITLQDALMNPRLRPAPMRGLQWIPTTDQFAYLSSPAGPNEALLRGQFGSPKRDTLLKTSTLGKGSGGIKFISPTQFTFSQSGKMLKYDLNTQKSETLYTFPEEAENQEFGPNQAVAFTIKNNVYLINSEGKQVQVTNEANPGVVCGTAAHRSEFGITKGLFWSADGSLLAFYRQDESMVTEYPYLDLKPLPAQSKTFRYPMAGQKSHEVTVGIFNLKTGTTTYLKTGEPAEQYLTNLTFSPDAKQIFVAHVNRAQNKMALVKYSTSTGLPISTLFEEEHPKYVEPENGPLFIKGLPGDFIWQSERDGYNHLYWYNAQGKLQRQLTMGRMPVLKVYGYYGEGKKAAIVFQMADASGMEKTIYQVVVGEGQLKQVSGPVGVHNGLLNTEKGLLIDSWQTNSTPLKTEVVQLNNLRREAIYTAPNPLEGYNVPKIEYVKVKNQAGQNLNARLITPQNVEKGKKLPVLVYVYNGPHVQLVQNSFLYAADYWMLNYANSGYVIFTIDGRGSANRGLEFENATHRNLGELEMDDQLSGLAYLKTLPIVDTNRIGVYGWSYGGYMASSLMCKRPGSFKAGIAGGAVIDWGMYEIMYTERYMDSPEENPEGYKKTSLLNHAKNLKGSLLLIHGADDDVVVWQHSLKMSRALIDEGKMFDYLVYPNEKHGVGGKARIHLMMKIKDWFDKNL